MYPKIEKLMQERGVSAYQVSKDTGISKASLHDWKTGRSSPKLDKIQILAKYFEVPITDLIEEDEQ